MSERMKPPQLVWVLSKMIDTGFGYLTSQGWIRYHDGICPPQDDRGKAVVDAVDERFRKAMLGLEDLRGELAEGESKF